MKKALSYGIRPSDSEFKIKLKCEMFDKFDSCLKSFKGFRVRNLLRLTYGNRYLSRTLKEKSMYGKEIRLKMKRKALILKDECVELDIPPMSEIKKLIDYSNNHPYD